MGRSYFRHKGKPTAKEGYKSKPWHDFTLPGYKYLGPGNRLDKGPPNNFNDAVAKEHDKDYTSVLDYVRANDADDRFINTATDDDYGGYLGRRYFMFKRDLANFGLIPNGRSTKALRGAENRKVATNYNIDPFPDTRKSNPNGYKFMQNKRMRTLDFDDNGPSPSLNNLPRGGNSGEGSNLRAIMPDASTNTGSGGDGDGSGNPPSAKETPVDDVWDVERGPSDYQYATLPFLQDFYTQDANTYARDFTYRMTSVYDCRVLGASVDLNPDATGTATVNTGVTDATEVYPTDQQQARWFNYYASMYNYYHVVSCRYHIFVENYGEPIWVYVMHHNDTTPPTGATNQDMQLWKDVKYHYCQRPYNPIVSTGSVYAVAHQPANENREGAGVTSATDLYQASNHTTSRGGKVTCVFTGEYRPGDFRREIRLDSEVETWTAVTTNPVLTERMTIRVKPQNDAISNTASVFGDDTNYRIRIALNYLVEFKELKDGLRWPTQRQPITVTINNSIFDNTG